MITDQKTRIQLKIKPAVLLAGMVFGGGMLVFFLLPRVKAPEKITCVSISAPGLTSTAVSSEDVPSFTQLNTLRTAYLRLGQKSDSLAGQKLRASLEDRKRILIQLAVNNPTELQAQFFTTEQKSLLSQNTDNCLETTIAVTGTLQEGITDDFEQKKEQPFFIISGADREFTVRSDFEYLRSVAEQEVTLTGERVDNVLMVVPPTNAKPIQATAMNVRQMIAEPPESGGGGSSPNVLVVPLNFSNTSFSTPTVSTLTSAAQTNQQFYDENSYHTASVRSVVHGWVTVPSTDPCPSYPSGNSPMLAQKAINQIGYDPSIDYSAIQRILLLAPFGSYCHWDGIAIQTAITLINPVAGGAPLHVFVAAQKTSTNVPSAYIMSHELGHTFGLGHSSYLKCPDGVSMYVLASDSRCVLNPYSDPFSTMGGYNTEYSSTPHQGQFTAPQKSFLGWLPLAQIQTIEPTATTTTYNLTPLEWDGPGTKMIKIPRNADSYLTLEFRQPNLSTGSPSFDSIFGTLDGEGIDHSGVYQGALVHVVNRVVDLAGYQTMMIDATPLPTNSNIVPVIPIGGSYIDEISCPVAGSSVGCTTIHVDGIVNNKLRVTVTMGAVDVNPPTITFTAPTGTFATGLTHFSATITDEGTSNGFDPNSATAVVRKTCGGFSYNETLPWNLTGDYDFGTTCVGTATVTISLTDQAGNYGSGNINLMVNNLSTVSSITSPVTNATLGGQTTVAGTWLSGLPPPNVPVITATAYLRPTTTAYPLAGVAAISASTWTLTWDTSTVPNGIYDIWVKTTDPNNQVTTTSVNTIRVQN